MARKIDPRIAAEIRQQNTGAQEHPPVEPPWAPRPDQGGPAPPPGTTQPAALSDDLRAWGCVFVGLGWLSGLALVIGGIAVLAETESPVGLALCVGGIVNIALGYWYRLLHYAAGEALDLLRQMSGGVR